MDADTCRLAREFFEEVAARPPARLKSQDKKVILATALLSSVASGDATREILRAVGVSTVHRLEMTG
jgi:hypothetical protein